MSIRGEEIEDAMAEAIAIIEEAKTKDAEVAHGMADEALLSFLEATGAYQLAEAWRAADKEVGFWYA